MPDRLVLDGIDLDAQGERIEILPGTWSQAMDRVIAERTKELTKQREAYCRKLLEARLPRPLHWTLDHPRALRILLRIVPHWRPTLTIVNLSRPPLATGGRMYGRTAAMHNGTDQAKQIADTWLAEQAAQGKEFKGIVFTYTDANGLPAEVYGP